MKVKVVDWRRAFKDLGVVATPQGSRRGRKIKITLVRGALIMTVLGVKVNHKIPTPKALFNKQSNFTENDAYSRSESSKERSNILESSRATLGIADMSVLSLSLCGEISVTKSKWSLNINSLKPLLEEGLVEELVVL